MHTYICIYKHVYIWLSPQQYSGVCISLSSSLSPSLSKYTYIYITFSHERSLSPRSAPPIVNQFLSPSLLYTVSFSMLAASISTKIWCLPSMAADNI